MPPRAPRRAPETRLSRRHGQDEEGGEDRGSGSVALHLAETWGRWGVQEESFAAMWGHGGKDVGRLFKDLRDYFSVQQAEVDVTSDLCTQERFFNL